MTTHLIIADRGTLDAIQDQADDLTYVDDSWDDMVHLNTDECWLFRTPNDSVPAIDDVGFIFGLDMGVGNSLPLIAACDLLGVDEI